jgi:NTP pyrophosphatase (non-canonical NTP hydrolase)
MDLNELQNLLRQFEEARGWDMFPASQVFAHLIEELGEIARHITTEEGYKVGGLGHELPKKDELTREFAQVFSLFMQLANHFKVDLESCVLAELKVMKQRFPEDQWQTYMKDR